jgi:hypothetical protein
MFVEFPLLVLNKAIFSAVICFIENGWKQSENLKELRLMKYVFSFLTTIALLFPVRSQAGFSPEYRERIFGINLIQTGGGWPYDAGALWLNAGTGFRPIGFPGFGNLRPNLPLLLSADYSYSPHLAAGPYLGYFRMTYYQPGVANQTRFSSYQFGGRWIFHGTDYLNDLFGLGIDIRQFDIYTGISAGIDIRSFAYEAAGKKGFVSDQDRRIFPRAGLILGLKYLLKQRIGLFAEAGRGSFGVFHFGATFKLIEKKRK